MSASTAIGTVGESLRSLLQDEMSLTPAAGVTLLAPDESGPARRINLFLYKVVENAHLKNQDWQVSRVDPARIVPPPLSINLFYLMTPYAQSDPNTGNTSAHEILGEAMRVFYQTPIVPPEHLADGLDDAREQIRIMLSPLDMEEITKVWTTFGEPYRLSVAYEVSVVQIDQGATVEQDMAPRVQTIGPPQVTAALHLPVVETLTPESGPAGSVLTFSGRNLSGRQATVRMSGQLVADRQPLTSDDFDVTLPTPLPAGFHYLQVDVSRLFRRSFVFEVTP
jgi:hypothetical protein